MRLMFVYGGILIAVLSITFGIKRIPSFAGPYRVIVRRVSNTSDEYNSTGGFWAKIRVTTPAPGHVPYGRGRIVNRIPIDDNIRIFVMIHHWSNNEWKKNSFQMNFAHACSDALHHAPSLLALLYGKVGHKCPIPVGDRIIPNKSLQLNFPEVPVFPYGRYLFVLIGFVRDHAVGIHSFEMDAIPKI